MLQGDAAVTFLAIFIVLFVMMAGMREMNARRFDRGCSCEESTCSKPEPDTPVVSARLAVPSSDGSDSDSQPLSYGTVVGASASNSTSVSSTPQSARDTNYKVGMTPLLYQLASVGMTKASKPGQHMFNNPPQAPGATPI